MRAFLVFFLLVFSNVTFSQSNSISIKGIVVAETGIPIPGATLKFDGWKHGIAANADGSFLIKVKSVPVIFKVSAYGYKNAKISVTDSQFVKFTLIKDNRVEEETIITM